MRIRRIVTAAATTGFHWLVAIIVALAVPVSQLRTVSVVTKCCCPDPSNCHCPDHKRATSNEPTMRDCHKTQTESVAQQLPSFTPPDVVIAIPPATIVIAIASPIARPHPAPAPRRPDAPS